MKLNELLTEAPKWVEASVLDWLLKKTTLDKQEIDSIQYLGSVDGFRLKIDGNVYLKKHVTEIPFPIDSLEWAYRTNAYSSITLATSSQLASLRNFPKHVNEIAVSFAQIRSLEGLDLKECNSLKLVGNPIETIGDIFPHLTCDLEELNFGKPDMIKSLVGISEMCKHSIKSMRIVCEPEEGGLGLLLVPGLKKLQVMDGEIPPFKIIEKYVGRPDKIYECQNELLDNGYEVYAQL